MAHWINIEEGTYPVQEAWLLTPAGNAGVAMDDAVIEVYLDGNNERRLRGRGMAIGMQIVGLLEDEDEIDLLLDLGEEFIFLLKAPSMRSGKVFAPDVKSLVHFDAIEPVRKLSRAQYREYQDKFGSA